MVHLLIAAEYYYQQTAFTDCRLCFLTQAQAAGKINPLMAEITMLEGEKGKNDGGSKNWRCNHCKKQFKSSLTRVRVHLLGALPGKKPQNQRCHVLLNDAAKTRELRDKVDSFFCILLLVLTG
jgi:hypothetical protein